MYKENQNKKKANSEPKWCMCVVVALFVFLPFLLLHFSRALFLCVCYMFFWLILSRCFFVVRVFCCSIVTGFRVFYWARYLASCWTFECEFNRLSHVRFLLFKYTSIPTKYQCKLFVSLRFHTKCNANDIIDLHAWERFPFFFFKINYCS